MKSTNFSSFASYIFFFKNSSIEHWWSNHSHIFSVLSCNLHTLNSNIVLIKNVVDIALLNCQEESSEQYSFIDNLPFNIVLAPVRYCSTYLVFIRILYLIRRKYTGFFSHESKGRLLLSRTCAWRKSMTLE